MARHQYRLALKDLLPQPVALETQLAARNPEPGDVDAIALLVLEAYRGSIDDEGETLVEAREFVASALSQDALLSASWLAVDAAGAAVSAILVRRWCEQPLVTFVVTRPDHKGRRLAQALTERALSALAAAGEEMLIAFITEGNTASERLFARLGFQLWCMQGGSSGAAMEVRRQ